MKNRKFSQDILKVWCGFKDNMTINTSFNSYMGYQDSIKWYAAYNDSHWKGSNVYGKGVRIECICEAVKRMLIDNMERTMLFANLPDFKSSINTINNIKVAYARYSDRFQILDANDNMIHLLEKEEMKNIFIKGNTEYVRALNEFNRLTYKKMTMNRDLQLVNEEIDKICAKYPMLKTENV